MAGGCASDDDAILLSAHLEADTDFHTGARSLPDMTLGVARHVAFSEGQLVCCSASPGWSTCTDSSPARALLEEAGARRWARWLRGSGMGGAGAD